MLRDDPNNRMNGRRLLKAMSALPFIGCLLNAPASGTRAPVRASAPATRAGRPRKLGQSLGAGSTASL